MARETKTGSAPDQPSVGWARKQAHYQDPLVVRDYDALRFTGSHQRKSTLRKWRALERALGAGLGDVRRVLDVPSGTGRFTRLLLDAGKEIVQADLSLPMLGSSRATAEGSAQLLGAVCADALALPFPNASFDLVLSIRFLHLVPIELRPSVMRECARVSRGWVVLDVRHKYCWNTWGKRVRARLARRPPPSPRYSLSQIESDLAKSGLVLSKRIWLAPLLSEKMLLVCRPAAAALAGQASLSSGDARSTRPTT